MNTKDQLLEKLGELMKIFASADDFISKLEQFSRILTEKEKTMFEKYPLLDVARFSFWDIAILEMCKLFNPRENFSLRMILNYAIDNYSKIPWIYDIQLVELRDFIGDIEQQKNVIKRLKRIRDSHIAHLDDKKYLDSLGISELRTLIDLSQKIYNKLYLGISNSEMIWDFKNDTIDMKAIKNLSKFESLREHILVSDFKSEEYICTKDLINILSNPD